MPESCRADSDRLSSADLRTSPQHSGYRLKAVNSEKAIEPMVPEISLQNLDGYGRRGIFLRIP